MRSAKSLGRQLTLVCLVFGCRGGPDSSAHFGADALLLATERTIESTGNLRFELRVTGSGRSATSTAPMTATVVVQAAAPGRPARLLLDGAVGAAGAQAASEPIRVGMDGQTVAVEQPAAGPRLRVAPILRTGTLLLERATRGYLPMVLAEGYFAFFAKQKPQSDGESVVDGVGCRIVRVEFSTGGGRRWHIGLADHLPRREERWEEGGSVEEGATTIELLALTRDEAIDEGLGRLLATEGTTREEWVPAGPAPGSPAPPFDLRGPGGVTVSLAALRGKVVVLDFWATWCDPCRASMPSLAALQRELGEEVAFIGATWQESGDPLAFAREHAIRYPIVRGDEVAEAYGISAVYGVPTLFVIDREGRIADFTVGYHGPASDAWLRQTIARARAVETPAQALGSRSKSRWRAR